MAQKAEKLKSERIAERIKQLEAEMAAQQEKEDSDADALLLRLAHRSHLRDDFIKQAQSAVKRHEQELARERQAGQDGGSAE